MQGADQPQGAMWSYVSPEARVPQDHPSRPMRQRVDTVLMKLSSCFGPLYAIKAMCSSKTAPA